MSRFADERAEKEVDLGPCECPGTPHASDVAYIRAQFSGSDIATLAAGSTDDEGAAADAVAPFVIRWNLLGPDGQDWPPSADSLRALMPPTLTGIVSAIGEAIEESSQLPNSSGAPSRDTSRRSASPTRTSRRPSTTSP